MKSTAFEVNQNFYHSIARILRFLQGWGLIAQWGVFDFFLQVCVNIGMLL